MLVGRQSPLPGHCIESDQTARSANRRYAKRRCACVIVYGLLIVCSGVISIDAAADEWVIRPAAKLEQRYDDNYRLSISSPDEVYTTRVAVESKLSRLTERAEADGLVRFDFIRYSGDTEELEDENNQLLHFSSLYRTSELNRLSIAGTYKRDTLLRTVEIIVDPEDDEKWSS